MAKMTARQQRFYDEYLIDLNATQAAIRAGHSKKSTRQAGAENLSKPVLEMHIRSRRNHNIRDSPRKPEPKTYIIPVSDARRAFVVQMHPIAFKCIHLHLAVCK